MERLSREWRTWWRASKDAKQAYWIVSVLWSAVMIAVHHLESWRWLRTLAQIVVGLIAWLALLSLIAWADAERRARKSNAQHPAAAPPGSAPSAPRLYVEFSDDREGLDNDTSLRVINRGDLAANNVMIPNITLRNRTVSFPSNIAVLPVGNSGRFAPDIDTDRGDQFKHDLVKALQEEWMSYGNPALAECIVPLRVVYEDYQRNRYETACEFVFDPEINGRTLVGGRAGRLTPIRVRNQTTAPAVGLAATP